MCYELIELSYGFEHAVVLTQRYIHTHTSFYVYIVHYVLGRVRAAQDSSIRNDNLKSYTD